MLIKRIYIYVYLYILVVFSTQNALTMVGIFRKIYNPTMLISNCGVKRSFLLERWKREFMLSRTDWGLKDEYDEGERETNRFE